MRILPFIAALLIACSGNGGGRAPKAALSADTPTQAGHSTLPLDTVTQSLSATALSMERQGMVNVQSVDPTIRVSLMYSRPDNFTGRVLYDDLREGYLHPKAAKALARKKKGSSDRTEKASTRAGRKRSSSSATSPANANARVSVRRQRH